MIAKKVTIVQPKVAYCAVCGRQHMPEHSFCAYCGLKLGRTIRKECAWLGFCTSCGRQLSLSMNTDDGLVAGKRKRKYTFGICKCHNQRGCLIIADVTPKD